MSADGGAAAAPRASGWGDLARQVSRALKETKPVKILRRHKIFFTTTPIIVGVLGAFHFWYSPEARINRIVAAFENGGAQLERLTKVDSELATVQRDSLLKQLVDCITGNEQFYKVIVGERGNGKSTAVRTALRTIRFEEGGPKGVLYYLWRGQHYRFSSTFAENCGYYRSTDRTCTLSLGERIMINLGLAESPPTTFETLDNHHYFWDAYLIPDLEEAASKYKQKHGHAPTLVIDAAEEIAEEDPSFLLKLQEYARSGANGPSDLCYCFVASGDKVHYMFSRSSASNYQTDLEVPDITDAEAVDYLVNKSPYKVPESTAKELVATVTGGRFFLLNEAAELLAEKRDVQTTVEHIRDMYYESTDRTLKNLKVKPDNDFFKKLVKDKKCWWDEVEACAGMSDEILDELVKAEIITDYRNAKYIFHSRHVETFFALKLASS